MTYIVVSENEIVKSEREKPLKGMYSKIHIYYDHLDAFKQYCLRLFRFPAPGHKWELWSEVVENVDFKFKKQSKGFESGEWEDCTDLHYSKRGTMSRRIVAIPIQNKIVKEDMICPETGKYCDDECCTVGSICNVSESTDGISPQPTPEGEKVFGEWQLCPKCNGDGNLARYNSPSIISTDASLRCDVCNGAKILARPLLTNDNPQTS